MYVVKDETRGLQLFSAIVNGIVALINQAGIAQNVAPVSAITLGIIEKKASFDIV